MGLQQNLNDIQTNLLAAKTAIAQSISNKGVECSADDKLSTYASKIDSISGGGTSEKFVVPDGLKFGHSTSFDPTMFDVSNVTDMSYMFYYSSGLTGELDLSTWNVTNAITLKCFFNNCSKLTNINVSTWNFSRVTDMSYMFEKCSGLTGLSLLNFNTENVKTMFGMFSSCTGITELNLSNFETSSLTETSYMFQYCSGLTSLNLSSFDLTYVSSMTNMFYNCRALTDLQLPDLGHNQSCTSLDLSSCSALTKDSILYLFNNAFDRAAAGYTTVFTIKLNATTKALLSEDELAIATNKGFTVV